MKNRIKEFRKKAKLTLAELAELAGTSAQQIFRLENGDRKLTQEWLNVLSKALKCSATDLLDDDLSKPVGVSVINKVGYVQAGKFNDAVQLPEAEWEKIPYPVDSKYKNAFALGVRGDSMNLVFPPELTTLICVPLEDWINANPDVNIEGKYIIAYRTAPDGKIEATVKKYTRIDFNTIILVAESSNPEIKPIILTPDNNEYTIHAVVVSYIRNV